MFFHPPVGRILKDRASTKRADLLRVAVLWGSKTRHRSHFAARGIALSEYGGWSASRKSGIRFSAKKRDNQKS
jgi:hypothetical protein